MYDNVMAAYGLANVGLVVILHVYSLFCYEMCVKEFSHRDCIEEAILLSRAFPTENTCSSTAKLRLMLADNICF